MTRNKNIILGGILVIILLISFKTYYEINKSHKEKLFNAMNKQVEEAALKCYNEENCLNDKIYLEELYEKDYLKEIINPLNNEYLDKSSYIEIKGLNEAELVIID